MGMGLEVVECPGESGPSVDEDFVSAGSVLDGATALTPLAAAISVANDAEGDAVSGSLASLIILVMTSENTLQSFIPLFLRSSSFEIASLHLPENIPFSVEIPW